MADRILIKRSAVPAKVPTDAQLAAGELAINTADGRLYLKKDNGTVMHLGDRATHTGLQPISSVTGLQTALDGKQPVGDYVADADPRLSDSREWTATVVPQAEAEGGTATTSRKWTAQRVRQAIVAWFNGVSGALGRTILTRTTAAQVRSDIGLGTAATFDSGFSGGLVATSAKTAQGVSYTGTSPDPTVKYSFGGATGGWARGIMNANLAGDTQTYGGFWFGLLGNQSNYTRGVIGFGNDTNWWQTAHQISLYQNQDPTVGTSNTIFHMGNLLKGTGVDDSFPMSQKAVTDALNTKANTSTQVIAGTGLSGGGNLSANRTLSVNYGTTAGTAAQGNDSRLSNSREWTADTVSQAEAETGTATTRRAWTAQRVRQASLKGWFKGNDKQQKASASGQRLVYLTSYSIFEFALSGNTTLVMSGTENVPSGETRSIVIRIKQGATARTLTWWEGITWLTSDGLAPPTPDSNKIKEYVLSYDGTEWIGREGASN